MKAAIVYANHAPFHMARLERSGAMGKDLGHTLIGIEIASAQSDYRWPDRYRRSEVVPLTLFPQADYWALPYRRIRRALHAALDRSQPDVVVLPGWGFKEAIAGLGWCLASGVPRVVISDSQPIDAPQHPVKLWYKRRVLRRYQAAFAGGSPHQRYLSALGMDPAACFPGCDVVDNDFFSGSGSLAPAPSIGGDLMARGPGSGILFSAIRLLPRKNVLGVLEALAQCAASWTWTIAGDGPQRAEIEETISRLGLKERVNLLGHVDYFALPAEYAKADVYLQPSLLEPWGLAVNEAMASGLPVLVSNRCGCHEDLVRDGVNGYTFDPLHPDSLVTGLERLWSNRDQWRSMGAESRRIVAAWGLDCYAHNLWQACGAAVRQKSGGLGEQALARAVSLLL